MAYRDLGLPPLGATTRRFGHPALQDDEAILDLKAIPSATLVRYRLRSVAGLLTARPDESLLLGARRFGSGPA